MDTIAEFEPDVIFSKVSSPKVLKSSNQKFEYEHYKVKVDTPRLRVFKDNKICVCCGIEGVKFLLQNHGGENPHFNFYAEKNGKLILMTKDHKRPASLGGDNSFNNLQTMCEECNLLKGDSPLTNEELKLVRTKHFELLAEGRKNKEVFYIIQKVKTFCINNRNYENKRDIGT